jgi:hypothetical protein
MKKKIYIEFIGMPGSGKTFFQKLITKNKDLKKSIIIKNNFKLLNKMQKLLYILLFIIRYPVFFYKTIYLLYIKKESASLKTVRPFFATPTRRLFYFFYNEIALRSYYNLCNKSCLFINSEGFLYRTCFYFKNNLNDKELVDYLKRIPKIHIIIFINSSKKKNVQRINKRKNGFKYSETDLRNYDKYSKLLNKIVNSYKNKNKDTKLLVFENKNQDTKKNLRNINNLINTVKNNRF